MFAPLVEGLADAGLVVCFICGDTFAIVAVAGLLRACKGGLVLCNILLYLSLDVWLDRLDKSRLREAGLADEVFQVDGLDSNDD